MILPTVLIVNTSPLIGKYLSCIVQQHGHNVTFASSGGEALTLALQCCFDVVILESDMPDWSGADLIRLFRKLNATRKLPVILLTPGNELDPSQLGPGLTDVLLVGKRNLAPERLLEAIDQAVTHAAALKPASRLLYIVTPNKRTGQSLAKLCTSVGYDVLLIPEVTQAIEKAPHIAPDAILLHYSSIKGKHAVLADTVLANPHFADTPLLLLTDHEDIKWASSRLERRPVTSLLLNPVESYSIHQHIEQLCEIREQRRALHQIEGVLTGVIEDLDTSRELLMKSERELSVARKYRRNLLPRIGRKLSDPITEVAAFARGLLDLGNLSPSVNDAVSAVLSASRDLLRITEGISHMVDLERGTLRINRRPCSPLDIIWKLEDEFRSRADVSQVDFVIESKSALPREIVTDPDRVHQVVAQLIYNAFKYTPKGRVAVTVEFESHANMLCLAVSDTGPGIAEERLPALFDPPWFNEDYEFEAAAGLGMGLPFVKQIIEKLDGTLQVSTRRSKGSMFRVGFDAGEVNREKLELGPLLKERRAASDAKQEVFNPSTISGKVLVAVESVVQQQFYEFCFKQTHIECEFAAHAGALLAAASQEDFGLVIVDLHPKYIDTLDAVRILREKNYLNPIIGTVNFLDSDSAKAYLKCGANAVLTKPFEARQLFNMVGFYLQEEISFQPETCPTELQPEAAAAVTEPETVVLEELESELEGFAPELAPMIHEFLLSLPKETVLLTEIFEEGNWHRLGQAARELSGNAGLFGYEPVATAALELYQAANTGSRNGAKAALDRLNALAERAGRNAATEKLPAQAEMATIGSEVPPAGAATAARRGSEQNDELNKDVPRPRWKQTSSAAVKSPQLSSEQREVAEGFLSSFTHEFQRILTAFDNQDLRRVAFVSNELAGAAALHGLRELCNCLLQVEQSCFKRDQQMIAEALQAAEQYVDGLGPVLVGPLEPAKPATPRVKQQDSPTVETTIIISELAESNPELVPIIAEFLGDLDGYLGKLRQAAASGQWQNLQDLAHEAAGAAGMYGYPQYRLTAKQLQTAANSQLSSDADQALKTLAKLTTAMKQGKETLDKMI